jgi:hypothetical protein
MYGIHSNKKVTPESNREAQERVRQQKEEKRQKLADARQRKYEAALELNKAEDQKRFTGVAPQNLGELRSRYQELTCEVKRYGG